MVKEIHVPKTLRESMKNYLAIKRAQKYQMEQKRNMGSLLTSRSHIGCRI